MNSPLFFLSAVSLFLMLERSQQVSPGPVLPDTDFTRASRMGSSGYWEYGRPRRGNVKRTFLRDGFRHGEGISSAARCVCRVHGRIDEVIPSFPR